jgi:hypothetical protein
MADVVHEAAPIPQVLAEIQAGDGLSLSAAGGMFPGHRGGKSVDPSTVFRWVTRGTRMTSGRAVKLEAVRVGARWLTSRGAVARFVAALTTAADPTTATSPPATRTPAARHKASERAAEKLERMGA